MKYNSLIFQSGEQITIVVINPFLHKTLRMELTIVSIDQQNQQYTCRRKGKTDLQFLPREKKLYKRLLFKGHNLPFTLDSETDRWDRNNYYHFVTDDSDNLRSFLAQHCLTLTNRNKTKIAYRPYHPDSMGLQQRRLYTDEQILRGTLNDDDCPFEV
jgi:hypothetical protein